MMKNVLTIIVIRATTKVLMNHLRYGSVDEVNRLT